MNNKLLEFVNKKKDEGINITNLIEQSGIGRTSFYGIMKGTQVPKLDTAYRLSNLFNVDVKDIFPDINKEVN